MRAILKEKFRVSEEAEALVIECISFGLLFILPVSGEKATVKVIDVISPKINFRSLRCNRKRSHSKVIKLDRGERFSFHMDC